MVVYTVPQLYLSGFTTLHCSSVLASFAVQTSSIISLVWKLQLWVVAHPHKSPSTHIDTARMCKLNPWQLVLAVVSALSFSLNLQFLATVDPSAYRCMVRYLHGFTSLLALSLVAQQP